MHDFGHFYKLNICPFVTGLFHCPHVSPKLAYTTSYLFMGQFHFLVTLNNVAGMASSPLESQYLGNDAGNQVYSRVSILEDGGATIHPGGLRNKERAFMGKRRRSRVSGQGGGVLVGSLCYTRVSLFGSDHS